MGEPDFSALLEQAQQMQAGLLAAQERLAATLVTGTSGGGVVTATVTGTGDLVGLDISPEVCDPEDTETLADLIVAAVRDATTEASAAAAESMGPLVEGLALPGA